MTTEDLYAAAIMALCGSALGAVTAMWLTSPGMM